MARLRLNQLPQGAEAGATQLQLVIRHGHRRLVYPLTETDTWLGSSSRCAICIEAAGVHARHVRIRRSGSDVSLAPAALAPVSIDGSPICGVAALAVGEPFTFGTASGVLEPLNLKDRIVAVALGSQLRDSPRAGISTPGALAHWNNILAVHASPGPSDLLSAFHKVTGVGRAAVYCRRHGAGWSLLARYQASGVTSAPVPEGASGVSLTFAADEWRLVYEGEDESLSAITHEIARVTLRVLAASGRLPPKAPPASTSAGSQSGGEPWSMLVGQQIRGYCAAYTHLCRLAENVLVFGETGTGKELTARSVHAIWSRKGPFVAVNCAAIPGDLLDAELFGVEAGAATGVSGRIGRIEQADGGTLFLDEISDLSHHLQGKLLRVLQEREYSRVGAARLCKADIRVIAASNRTESELCGTVMRSDLFFRLSQATIPLPPLRERPADLAELCSHFLAAWEARFARGVLGLSLGALEALTAYHWPGNVRELQNVLRTMYAAVPDGGLIERAHVPPLLAAKRPAPTQGSRTLASLLEEVEKAGISDALDRNRTVRDAANSLGLSESYLYRRIKKLGILPRTGTSRWHVQ